MRRRLLPLISVLIVLVIMMGACNDTAGQNAASDDMAQRAYEKYPWLKDKPHCPVCGSADVAGIVYGMPLPDETESPERNYLLQNGEIINEHVVLGGFNAEWRCKSCGCDFMSDGATEAPTEPNTSALADDPTELDEDSPIESGTFPPEPVQPTDASVYGADIVPVSGMDSKLTANNIYSVLQLRMKYTANRTRYWVTNSVGILVNRNTLITGTYLTDIKGELKERLNMLQDGDYDPDSITYEVLVNGGVPIRLNLTAQDKDAGYAVFETEEDIVRPTAILDNKSVLKPGDTVYAMGYKDDSHNFDNTKIFSVDDLLASEFKIKRIDTVGGIDYIVTDHRIPKGFIGGPLLNEDGYVVGIVTDVFETLGPAAEGYAVSIGPVYDTLGVDSSYYSL